jgi:bisphosphoglycerate-dependent phosphoglycerate mutase
MHLEEMSEREVEQFEIPTGQPLIVEFAPDGNFLRRNYRDAPVAAPTIKASG